MLERVVTMEDQSQEWLRALYDLSLELSGEQSVDSVLSTALRQCLDLTESEFGFIGLVTARPVMEIAAIQGFHPAASFFADHRFIPLRPNIFANSVLENRAVRSEDALSDPHRVGQPDGHPPVGTFLGVPLRIEDRPIGMIGVANRPMPYTDDHEQLMLTYAAQIAILIRNAQLLEALTSSNEQLETTVVERTRQLEGTRDELVTKAADLKAALTLTVDAQERERKRIAQDVHDGLNQLIIGALLQVKSGKDRLSLGNLDQADDALDSALGVLRQVDNEIRRVVHHLHPPNLEELGLAAATRRLGQRFEEYYEVPCSLETIGDQIRLGPEVEIAVYRIVQEALQNVGAHAEASKVQVVMSFENSAFKVSIDDDGAGFDVDAVFAGHYGLRSMRDRAEGFGGTFGITSTFEDGSRIAVEIPMST